MAVQLFKKQKELTFDRVYDAPIAAVWDAWTQAEILRQWWGPNKTAIVECRVEPTVGGEIYVVMEATAEMGKYAGTRWPMAGTFTSVEPHVGLSYDARSWVDGEEAGTAITHTNDLTLTEEGGRTHARLTITISNIGPDAKMAVMGMKMGYKAQLKKLEAHLADGRSAR